VDGKKKPKRNYNQLRRSTVAQHPTRDLMRSIAADGNLRKRWEKQTMKRSMTAHGFVVVQHPQWMVVIYLLWHGQDFCLN